MNLLAPFLVLFSVRLSLSNFPQFSILIFMPISIFISVSFFACGNRSQESLSTQGATGVVLSVAGKPVMVWPADHGLLARQMTDSRYSGISVLRVDAVPTYRGTRYADGRSVVGLLALPQVFELKKCPVYERLIDLTHLMRKLEQRALISQSLIQFNEVFFTEEEACSAVPMLDCALNVFTAQTVHKVQKFNFQSSTSHPLLEEKKRLDACFRPSTFVASADGKSYFDIVTNTLVFEPSKLFSVFIYDEIFTNLAVAISQKAPVAVISSPQNGVELLESPLSLKSCIGCQSLSQGAFYAAYLVLATGQLNEEVLPIVFEGP